MGGVTREACDSEPGEVVVVFTTSKAKSDEAEVLLWNSTIEFGEENVMLWDSVADWGETDSPFCIDVVTGEEEDTATAQLCDPFLTLSEELCSLVNCLVS